MLPLVFGEKSAQGLASLEDVGINSLGWDGNGLTHVNVVKKKCVYHGITWINE